MQRSISDQVASFLRRTVHRPMSVSTTVKLAAIRAIIHGGKKSPVEAARDAARQLASRNQPMTIQDLLGALIAKARTSQPHI